MTNYCHWSLSLLIRRPESIIEVSWQQGKWHCVYLCVWSVTNTQVCASIQTLHCAGKQSLICKTKKIVSSAVPQTHTRAHTINAGWVRLAFYILLPFYFVITKAEDLATVYMQCLSAVCQEVGLVKMIKDPKYCMSGRARGRCEYSVCVCVARCVTVELGRIMLALFSSHWLSAKPTPAWRWMRMNTCVHTHTHH